MVSFLRRHLTIQDRDLWTDHKNIAVQYVRESNSSANSVQIRSWGVSWKRTVSLCYNWNLIWVFVRTMVNYVGKQTQPQTGNRQHCPSPLSVVFHRDLKSPIQYDLSMAEIFRQSVSWLLSDGRPSSLKIANDPPWYKQSLLALYHDSWLSNFL